MKAERVKELVAKMVKLDLVNNDPESIAQQTNETMRWNDEALGAMERLLVRHEAQQ